MQLLKMQFQTTNWEPLRVCGSDEAPGFPLEQSPHLRVLLGNLHLSKACPFHCESKGGPVREPPVEKLYEGLAFKKKGMKKENGRDKANGLTVCSYYISNETATSDFQAPLTWWTEARFANRGVQTWEGRVKHDHQMQGVLTAASKVPGTKREAVMPVNSATDGPS